MTVFVCKRERERREKERRERKRGRGGRGERGREIERDGKSLVKRGTIFIEGKKVK